MPSPSDDARCGSLKKGVVARSRGERSAAASAFFLRMKTILRYGARARVRRRLLLLVCAAAALAVPGATRVAGAAVTCPNSNPIVQENQCAGRGDDGVGA